MPQTTDQLIERLNEEFDLDDIDESGDEIYYYLTSGKTGPHRIKYGTTSSGKQRYETSGGLSSTGLSKIRNLAAQFGESKRIYSEAETSESPEHLDELKKESRFLVFKQKKVNDFIDTRKKELQLSIDSQLSGDIEETESELKDIEKETSKLESKKEDLLVEIGEAETAKERNRVEPKLIDVELTLQEREDARQRLQDKIKQLTRRRGRR